jgi:RNA polymerase sigma-70 factor, ECF subfamily
MRSDADFDAFYQASYHRLVGQVTVLAGSLEDAEDAVQEAFARASTRWARLRDYDAPEAWVRRVAFNLAPSGLRRARRQLAALARLGAPAPEPGRSTDRLAIEAGLRRLPLHYRQVLVLYCGADQPVEQVAQQLRLPPGGHPGDRRGPGRRPAAAQPTGWAGRRLASSAPTVAAPTPTR